MSLTLILFLVLLVVLVVVSLWAMRLHFSHKQHDEQLQSMYQSGQLNAKETVTRELCYSIGIHKLLSQTESAIPVKWQKAFEALYPEHCTSMQLTSEDVTPLLREQGFTREEVGRLIRWRANHPELVITLLLSLMSGVPEEKAWGIAQNV